VTQNVEAGNPVENPRGIRRSGIGEIDLGVLWFRQRFGSARWLGVVGGGMGDPFGAAAGAAHEPALPRKVVLGDSVATLALGTDDDHARSLHRRQSARRELARLPVLSPLTLMKR
jgi:hypothetical protein